MVDKIKKIILGDETNCWISVNAVLTQMLAQEVFPDGKVIPDCLGKIRK